MQSTRHQKRQKNLTQTYKAIREYEDVTALCKQGVNTDKEIFINRLDIIIKKERERNVRTERCGNISREECQAKRKEIRKYDTGVYVKSYK